MKKQLLTLVALVLSLVARSTDYDLNKPFGFCTRASRTDAAKTYDVTGGGCYTYPIPKGTEGVVILKSNGGDMKNTIQDAIKSSANKVIILDGFDGDFIVSSNVVITASDKTLLGINNARLCTKWYVTDEIKAALNAAGVPSMSTSGGGGTLPNGMFVKEEAEYNTRKIIMEMSGDNSESYRNSGILSLKGCQNIIIRNITLVGPGSIDVGGSDLISSNGAKNCWIDHCAFMDGMDGNFDIGQKSDFFTVSWCTFSYTDHSYMHQNTNLIGSSDREAMGYLNTTFAYCWWGTGCKQRMPMARAGKIHMLNNYFSSTTASNCINPRKNSEFLIEGNYFEKGVKHYYSQNDATAVTWKADNYIAESNSMPASLGNTVTVPYDYPKVPYSNIPTAVKLHAGATLFVSDEKPRVLISTDIGGTDPDDNQSVAHLLMYSNEFDLEGLVSSPSFGDGSTSEIFRMIDVYEKDLPQLSRHIEGLMKPKALRKLVKQGRMSEAPACGYGEPTEGSQWIVRQARKKDSRPLYVLVWGCLEDVAQALHDAPDIAPKLRVHWIGGPNKKWGVNGYRYIIEHFPDLWMIENNTTYRGFIYDSKNKDEWNAGYFDAHIKDAGNLGRDFAAYYKGNPKLGDTPSLLYMMKGDPTNPETQSWGGRFVRCKRTPRVVFHGATTAKDTAQICGIIEWQLRGPVRDDIAIDSACVTLDIRKQQWKGYYKGNGLYVVSHSTYYTGTLSYTITSTIEGFAPISGEITVENTWDSKSHDTDYQVGNHWWTDSYTLADYWHDCAGANTQRIVRKKIMEDWAQRWSWLK